ncbi:hypothetical protein HK104_007726, partial [Borealophlyctis nickersoniae]
MEGQAAKMEEEMFVEERYGRNLDVRFANEAKITLRKRIAGILGDHLDSGSVEKLGGDEQTDREVAVTEDDVFLFPTGMSSIYNTFRVILSLFPDRKTVQFGFPYIDTLKIQEKFGPGCIFLGHGTSSDLDRLEHEILPTTPISALFCEFPSNPLLRSADLRRIRQLADKWGFLVVVDETVGNFVNVAVLQWADVVVSSLTKIFSGDSNVMGGSAILNPSSKHYASLSAAMRERYQDTVWCEDAIFLERNSRSFRQRIHKINVNAEALCDFLHSHPK